MENSISEERKKLLQNAEDEENKLASFLIFCFVLSVTPASSPQDKSHIFMLSLHQIKTQVTKTQFYAQHKYLQVGYLRSFQYKFKTQFIKSQVYIYIYI